MNPFDADRHGPDLGGRLRPRLPAGRRLPERRRTRPTSCAPRRRGRAALDADVGGQGRRARPPHPQPSRPAHRLVGARRDRHGARWRRRSAALRGVPAPTHRASASTPRWSRCPVGCGCARASRRTAEEIVTELWGEVFGRADDGGTAREKLTPRLGPTPSSPPSPKEGDAADEAVAEAPKRTTSRRELARHDALRADLARGRRARRGGLRRARWRTTPTRRWRCSPTSPGRPTRSCASWPAASPAGCSSTSPGGARPARAASARIAHAAATGPTAATSTSTPASTPIAEARGARRAARRRATCGSGRGRKPGTALCLLVDRSGSMGGEPLATAAVAAAAVAWRGAATTTACWPSARTSSWPRPRTSPKAARARWSTTCSRCAASAPPTSPARCRSAADAARPQPRPAGGSPCCCRTAGRRCPAT